MLFLKVNTKSTGLETANNDFHRYQLIKFD